LKFTSNKMYGGSRLIKRDDDGYFYIDYIGYSLSVESPSKIIEKVGIKQLGIVGYKRQQEGYIQSNNNLLKLHKEAIEDMYSYLLLKEGTEEYKHIFKKYNWIKNYHNKHLIEDRKKFIISEN